MKNFLLIVGAALIAVGLLVGLTPVTAYQRAESISCGSVFMSKTEGVQQRDSDNAVRGRPTNFSVACGDKLGSRSLPAWGLIIVGLAVAGGSRTINSGERGEAARS
jgi:hypothetical protein